jgi:hypothetical protein
VQVTVADAGRGHSAANLKDVNLTPSGLRSFSPHNPGCTWGYSNSIPPGLGVLAIPVNEFWLDVEGLFIFKETVTHDFTLINNY